MKTILNTALFLLGVALVLMLAQYTGLSFTALFEKMSEIEPRYLAAVFALVFVTFIALSARWALIVMMITDRRPFRRGYFFYYTCLSMLSTVFVSNLAGNIGVKSASLKLEHKVPVLSGSCSAVIEHAMSLFTLFIMLIPSLLFAFGALPAGAAFMLMSAVITAAFLTFDLYYKPMLKAIMGVLLFLAGALNRVPLIKGRIDTSSLKTASVDAVDRGFAKRLFLFTLLVYGSMLAAYYVSAAALDIEIPFLPFCLIFPAVYLVASVGITPSALGIAELGWFGMLSLIGIDPRDAAVYVVGRRILFTAVIMVISFLGCGWYLARGALARRETAA